MSEQYEEQVRQAVREHYAQVATAGCGCGSCGCGESVATTPAERLGYTSEQVELMPEGANLGLGCGNPLAAAALQPGETVLDLGSGGGLDCFLAAQVVGEGGRVIGVDMTAAMIQRARAIARERGFKNVEFRLGEIERLPVADASVDVIISNCVINLSPDKPQVLAEAWRVLKPGGRFVVSDVVATAPLPPEVRDDLRLVVGCIAGAAEVTELRAALEGLGFVQVSITEHEGGRALVSDWLPGRDTRGYLSSAVISALRPR